MFLLRSLLIVLSGVSLRGQVVLEDFRCTSIVDAKRGALTTLTCNEPHGMEGLHAWTVASVDSLNDGAKITIDGVSYTLRTTLDGAIPGQVLIGPDKPATKRNLVHAINDDGIGKGTSYSAATAAHPSVYATDGIQPSGGLWVFAKAAGPEGQAIRVSGSGMSTADGNLQLQWMLYVKGGTGAWADIGSNQTPKSYANPTNKRMARYVSPTQFTLPWDSTRAGEYAGQKVTVMRGNGDTGQLFYVATDESWASQEAHTAEGWSAQLPTCNNPADEAACSAGFIKPENQKGYMCRGNGAGKADVLRIASFEVAGPEIAITLNGIWEDCPTYPKLTVGQLMWIRGYRSYTTADNPGHLPAQEAARPFSGNQQMSCDGTCRGFVVQNLTTTGGRTRITIKNPGLKDGSYTGTCTDRNCGPVVSGAPYVSVTWWATPYIYFMPRWTGYYTPSTTMVGMIKRGQYPLPREVNRLVTLVKYNVTADRAGHYTGQLGTYVQSQPQSLVGSIAHYYHMMDPRMYADQWYKLEVTNVPTHLVGEPGNGVWPNNPTILSPYGTFAGAGDPPSTYLFGLSPVYRSFTLDTVRGEPDEWVPMRMSVWAPQRYIGGRLTPEPGYEVHWFGQPINGVRYEVRYSAKGSLKTAGFSTGLCRNGTTSCDHAEQVSAPDHAAPEYYWQSPAMRQERQFWVGIRPVMPISWAAASGGAFWVGAEADPMMAAGDHATVILQGKTFANREIQGALGRQVWWLHAPQNQTEWKEPGQLTGIVANKGVCQANLTTAHHLTAGWKIKIMGTASPALGTGAFDLTSKNFLVSKVVDPQAFQFACPGVENGTYASDVNGHMVIMSYPGILIPGESPGYRPGGTIVSTDENRNFSEIELTGPSSDEQPGARRPVER